MYDNARLLRVQCVCPIYVCLLQSDIFLVWVVLRSDRRFVRKVTWDEDLLVNGRAFAGDIGTYGDVDAQMRRCLENGTAVFTSFTVGVLHILLSFCAFSISLLLTYIIALATSNFFVIGSRAVVFILSVPRNKMITVLFTCEHAEHILLCTCMLIYHPLLPSFFKQTVTRSTPDRTKSPPATIKRACLNYEDTTIPGERDGGVREAREDTGVFGDTNVRTP